MDKIIKIMLISFVVTTLCFGTSFGSFAFAKGKGAKGGIPAGFSKGEKRGWKGESTPPGWAKGEKKGWDESDLPPRLSEKESEK
jgi:hypothetical protein